MQAGSGRWETSGIAGKKAVLISNQNKIKTSRKQKYPQCQLRCLPWSICLGRLKGQTTCGDPRLESCRAGTLRRYQGSATAEELALAWPSIGADAQPRTAKPTPCLCHSSNLFFFPLRLIPVAAAHHHERCCPHPSDSPPGGLLLLATSLLCVQLRPGQTCLRVLQYVPCLARLCSSLRPRWPLSCGPN